MSTHTQNLNDAQQVAAQTAAELAACKAEVERLAQARKELVALAAQDQSARERLAALTEASVKAQIEADNARMEAEIAEAAARKQALEVEEARQRDVVKRVQALRARLGTQSADADATFVDWVNKTVGAQLLADELARLLKTELSVDISVVAVAEVPLRDGGRLITQHASKGREVRVDGFQLSSDQVAQIDRQLVQSANYVQASRFAG